MMVVKEGRIDRKEGREGERLPSLEAGGNCVSMAFKF
jgi:hypothetical protein